jgi:hypothetical protein
VAKVEDALLEPDSSRTDKRDSALPLPCSVGTPAFVAGRKQLKIK